MGPCLGHPSDPPGNLSGVVFGATKIQRLFTHRESSGTQNHYKRLSNPNLTQEFQVAFLNQFMNNSSVLEKETTFKWEAIRCLVGGFIGRIRMYKSIGTPNFYYILMNFLGYRVLFGVYKSWLYTPRRRRRRRRATTTLGALT